MLETAKDEKRNKKVAKLRFIAKLSMLGDRPIISVPKELWDEAKKLRGKQLRVQLDDEW
jgi:hypothetical protein